MAKMTGQPVDATAGTAVETAGTAIEVGNCWGRAL